jgi:hypothetical protein
MATTAAKKSKKPQIPRAKNLVKEPVPVNEGQPERPQTQYPPSLEKYVRLADVALGRKPKS